ncbi:alpha/beta fold hydrolase [Streptomyces sp. XD-27]|uniref:alpha/beta fold hydrolase n=1 Tax=Streptomyces sp. XD-27 TaxID=3062779 RepID=UPI0026F43860|nr:alpha/beta fold hydrolase [Streptomyces sp. XD-27]WKX70528.1 alpha/beta fold hydrolase [Streptomyces sp. XD-27]
MSVVDTEPAQPVVVRRARAARTEGIPLRVLLLHGLAGSAAVWEPFAERADPVCELWTAELPWRGYGVRGWADRPVEDWVEQAVARLPHAPDVVIGHSFGGNAALAWLSRRDPADSGVPRGAVLVSPFYRPRQEHFDWDAIAYYLNRFQDVIADGLRVSSRGRLAPAVQEEMARVLRDRIGPYGWMRFFDTYLDTPRLPVERLLLPFLILGGETDIAAFPRDARTLAGALPDATARILPDVGHFTMVERAAEFADAVNGFLRTLSPARPAPGRGPSADSADLPAMEYD